MKTTLHLGMVGYSLMFNSGGCWGARMKGLNMRINGNIKLRKENIGINEAELIDCNMIDRLKTSTGWRASKWGSN